jgi:hypothetical protein
MTTRSPWRLRRRTRDGTALVLLMAALVSCHPRSEHIGASAAPQRPVDLVGSWELDVQPAADNPTFRPWITVAIDSVTDGTIHGQLRHYLVGNMGIETGAFKHVDGELGQGDTVRIAIDHADPAITGLRFVGHALGDTIRLDTLVVGSATLSSGGAGEWMLIRRR